MFLIVFKIICICNCIYLSFNRPFSFYYKRAISITILAVVHIARTDVVPCRPFLTVLRNGISLWKRLSSNTTTSRSRRLRDTNGRGSAGNRMSIFNYPERSRGSLTKTERVTLGFGIVTITMCFRACGRETRQSRGNCRRLAFRNGGSEK